MHTLMCIGGFLFVVWSIHSAYHIGKDDGEASGFVNGIKCAEARQLMWNQYRSYNDADV